MANTSWPVGTDEGGSWAIDAIYYDPIAQINYQYRGGGKWDIVSVDASQNLTNYYTRSEVDSLQDAQDVTTASNTATISAVQSTANAAYTLAAAAIPATQKGANNGVAGLGADGKVPTAQLPDAIVTGVPSWSEVTSKPTEFTPESHSHAQSDITNLTTDLASKLNASSYTAADVKAKLITVDGAGSGVDADLLDGYHAASFSLVGHDHTGVYATLSHTHSEYFEIDTNTSPVATNYEIGQYLFGAEPSTGTELNASLTLYVDSNDDTCGLCADVDYRRGVTTTSTSNTVLSGTWRFRGRWAGGGLYQRVL